jgi:hypothetical protein
LLAVFASIRHFRFVLEGRPFRILTDHLPLTLAMRRVSPLWSARQVRQLAYVPEFSTDIPHTPGLRNVVADALSRPSTSPPVLATVPVGNLNTATATGPPAARSPPTIDYAAMAAAQPSCADCSKMCGLCSSHHVRWKEQNCLETSLQERFDRWCRRLSASRPPPPSTGSPILVSRPRFDWLPASSAGPGSANSFGDLHSSV